MFFLNRERGKTLTRAYFDFYQYCVMMIASEKSVVRAENAKIHLIKCERES